MDRPTFSISPSSPSSSPSPPPLPPLPLQATQTESVISYLGRGRGFVMESLKQGEAEFKKRQLAASQKASEAADAEDAEAEEQRSDGSITPTESRPNPSPEDVANSVKQLSLKKSVCPRCQGTGRVSV
ncbi:hypothetical protein VKT23_000312 [Stygiomarasmius scandens]|uniref:Uncharacterized protein n=1 Tax=Marasmiellus scandens TaxID=2682957 RepID=A0ABR1K742_9AGAR